MIYAAFALLIFAAALRFRIGRYYFARLLLFLSIKIGEAAERALKAVL